MTAWFAQAAGAAPRVVVSLKPFHSLVAAVMDGVGTPALLLGGATSPHIYTLKPSDSRALAEAEVVVWGGEGLETYLRKPIEAVAARARIVTLGEDAGLLLLPARDAGEHERQQADAHGTTDMHFWLDPENAGRVVTYVAAVLSSVDPVHAKQYAANRDVQLAALRALDAEVAETLRDTADKPFLTLHDALQYWETRYHLTSLGSLTVNPDRTPGARALGAMRAAINDSGARCIFGEPQFPKALGAALVDGTGAQLATVDTLGAAVPPGIQAYAEMLRGLAQAFRTCLVAERP